MLVTEQEVLEVRKFVNELNSIENSVAVVEGRKDSTDLRKLGFTGKVLEFYKFAGMVDFADLVAKYERIIILFDRDRKGRSLTGKRYSIVAKKDKDRSFFQKKITANHKR